jgi:putative pyruvate formate lyase activating enzyme
VRSIDLGKEPIALSVVQEDETKRVSFSDIPEVLLPQLIDAFGQDAVSVAISPTITERQFYSDLPLTKRKRPRYRDLLESGELEKRVRTLEAKKKVAAKAPYFMAAINRSDEAALGRTGAIYFVCRKGCHFCQYRNFEEHTLDAEGIAARMLALQKDGADNVQWVSPTSYTGILVKALFLAAKEGLTVPIVHKSEGEDVLEDLAMLDGVVDIYLPDIKFVRPRFADQIGLPASYVERMKLCIREMHRQVGPLVRAKEGSLVASSGLLVRHLLMPGGVIETREMYKLIKKLDPNIPVHVMVNYEPLHAAKTKKGIDRHLTAQEIRIAVKFARHYELPRVYVK